MEKLLFSIIVYLIKKKHFKYFSNLENKFTKLVQIQNLKKIILKIKHFFFKKKKLTSFQFF